MVRKLKNPEGGSWPAGTEFTKDYEQVEVPESRRWPRFTVIHEPRERSESDDEHRLARRYAEQNALNRSMLLRLSQLAVGKLGWWETCPMPARKGMRRTQGRGRLVDGLRADDAALLRHGGEDRDGQEDGARLSR